jgi:acetyl esterase/lipase
MHFPADVPQRPFAVLVFAHGGGWNAGSPEMLYELAEGLADRGVLPFLPEYRLLKNAGEAGIAAPVEDVARAWAWVGGHLPAYGISSASPVFFGGGSAGGHLALMARRFHPDAFAEEKEPTGWVLGNPVVNTSEAGFGYRLLGGDWRAYSPHLEVLSLPSPVLYLQGSADATTTPPLAQSFVETLRSGGTRVDLRTAEGAQHGFFNALAYREWTVGAIMDFMERTTGERAG